jgi:uncharacterized LabA/DUF88 family protein
MASPQDNVSMALFCDFENVALGVRDANYEQFDIKPILERLLLKGSIVIKKAYCDWDRYKGFKKPMHEANFELIEIPHVRQSGKNSADIRLVVDALDLCYTKSHVNTFVIISGDSDFSPLVSKLRENNKQVIGVGVKQSTSDLLVANCDEFIFYDDLVRENQRRAAKRNPGTREAQPANNRSPEEEKRRKDDVASRRSKAIELAVETFDALVLERGDGGKMWASVLKEAIKRRKPDFNESYYGFRAFGNLLEEAQARGLLEFGRDEKSGTYVYRGNGGLSDVEPTAERVSQDAESDTAPASRRREPRQRGGRNSASRLRDTPASQSAAPRDAQAALPLANAEARSEFAQDQDDDDAHTDAGQLPSSYDSGVDTWMSVQHEAEDDVPGDGLSDVTAAPAAERQVGRSDEKRNGEKTGRGARNRGGRRGRENTEARPSSDQTWPVAQDESPVAPWDELPAVSAAGPQADPFEDAPRARDVKAAADARESQDEAAQESTQGSGQESGQGSGQGSARSSARESRDPARSRTRETGRNRGRGAKNSTATSTDASPVDNAPAAPAVSSAPEAAAVNAPAATVAPKPFIGNAFLLPESAQVPSTKKAATVTRAPRRRRAVDPAEASAENMAAPVIAAEPSTVDAPVAPALTKKSADKNKSVDGGPDGEAATDAKPAARKTAARSRRPRKTTSTPDAG